jgi:ABC-type branched-subunit amino acid transport system ATPase component
LHEALKQWILTLSNEGISVLLVSHDMGLMDVAARVQVLYYDEIIAAGSMTEIQNDTRVLQVYLGARLQAP